MTRCKSALSLFLLATAASLAMVTSQASMVTWDIDASLNSGGTVTGSLVLSPDGLTVDAYNLVVSGSPIGDTIYSNTDPNDFGEFFGAFGYFFDGPATSSPDTFSLSFSTVTGTLNPSVSPENLSGNYSQDDSDTLPAILLGTATLVPSAVPEISSFWMTCLALVLLLGIIRIRFFIQRTNS